MCKKQCPNCKCKTQKTYPELKVEVEFKEHKEEFDIDKFLDSFLEFLSSRDLCYGGTFDSEEIQGHITFSDSNKNGGITDEDIDIINDWFGDILDTFVWDCVTLTKVKE